MGKKKMGHTGFIFSTHPDNTFVCSKRVIEKKIHKYDRVNVVTSTSETINKCQVISSFQCSEICENNFM